MREEDGSSNYCYLLIRDAKKSVNMKVNLFSKVSEVGTPKRSRGSDYVVTLKLVDQSCPTSGLKVNFFAASEKNLPKVRSAGDIISLHQVEVKIYSAEVFCLFNKRFSSFALYYGETDKGLCPYQTSASYQATDYASELIRQLRTLPLGCQSDDGLENPIVLLRSISIGKLCDVICKVIYMQKNSEDEWMLFVWDGTDSLPVAFQTDLDIERETPTPLHLEEQPLPKEILCNFPREGTVLRVTTSKFVPDIHRLLGVACWVKICNITCELQSGIWKAMTTPYSKFNLLSDDDGNVQHRQRIYHERMASKVERMPTASFPAPSRITETDYENFQYSTLMDSLTHRQVLHKFKCVVRVVASCPWRAEDLRSPVDGHYRIRLTLEDPTARIRAYICDKDGVKFFGGNPAPDELRGKMNKLLGMKDPGNLEDHSASRNPPWIWCCIWSFYTNESDPWGSRRYRIIGTELVG
ncbi:putative protection of telomeres protein 1b [Iris pallida]|uniref:Protection of telomeres protein 1b n=1 Tax=Iris pallida TaxID=29817 RepID=A0AAX6FMG7_IRIPA|nr:putative protection of telomeres protein 1b [Iris pallida]